MNGGSCREARATERLRTTIPGALLFTLLFAAAAWGAAPSERNIEFRGAERSYFVALPADFNPEDAIRVRSLCVLCVSCG